MVSGTLEVTPLPLTQGLSQRTAGAQASTSRLSRQGDDADVELGFLDEEAGSPSMLGMQALSAFSVHASACVSREGICVKSQCCILHIAMLCHVQMHPRPTAAI